MRTLIDRFLQARAKSNLMRHPSIRIHETAVVNYRGVRYRHGSLFEIGEGSTVHASLVAERDGAHISIGKNTAIGNSLISCASRIDIGDNVFISWGCTIFDHDSHATEWKYRQFDIGDRDPDKKIWTHVPISPVVIGAKAWLGLNVIVLKGVHIGEGAVVAAGSVVVKDVQPWTIVAGNPAKFIREIPLEDQ